MLFASISLIIFASSPVMVIASDNLEEAKTKCSEIGFTPKTEAFGNCVLQLLRSAEVEKPVQQAPVIPSVEQRPALPPPIAPPSDLPDDRRPLDVQTEDKNIALGAESRINDRFGDKAHVNVNSFNLNVLLTGEAPDAAAKAEIERIVREAFSVRGLANQIEIAEAIDYTARAYDRDLTTRIGLRLIENRSDFSASHVKVVTEGRVVYLMGRLTRKEANAAVEIVRTTGGVRKVVRVFEYIKTPPE